MTFLRERVLNLFKAEQNFILFWWFPFIFITQLQSSWLTSSCSLWNFSFFLIASCTLSCNKKKKKILYFLWEFQWKWTYPMYRLFETLLWTSIHLEMPQSFMCLLYGRMKEKEKKKWISEYVERTSCIAERKKKKKIYWNSWIFHKFYKKRLLQCPVVCEAIQWDIHREILINKSKAF